jgi:hypothetical protein
MITHLSAELALQRLARSIEKEIPLLPFQPRPRSWLFAGTIHGNHFSICRIPAGKRIYENQIDGVVEPAPDGARITLTIQAHSMSTLTSMIGMIVLSFFGLLFVLGPLYFAFIGQLPWNCGLFPLIVAALGVFFLRALPSSAAPSIWMHSRHLTICDRSLLRKLSCHSTTVTLLRVNSESEAPSNTAL